MDFDATKVTRALLRKGLEEINDRHKAYRLIVDGKETGIFTVISHGRNTIGDSNIDNMRKQMHLSRNDFIRFVKYDLTGEAYKEKLRCEGYIG